MSRPQTPVSHRRPPTRRRGAHDGQGLRRSRLSPGRSGPTLCREGSRPLPGLRSWAFPPSASPSGDEAGTPEQHWSSLTQATWDAFLPRAFLSTWCLSHTWPARSDAQDEVSTRACALLRFPPLPAFSCLRVWSRAGLSREPESHLGPGCVLEPPPGGLAGGLSLSSWWEQTPQMWSVGMHSLERGAWGKPKPQDLAGLGSSPRVPN